MDSLASRLALSHKSYLSHFSIEFYVEDLVSLILTDRPKDPTRFAYDYFCSIRDCTNVICREFEYISATFQNRLAFVACLARLFRSESHHLSEIGTFSRMDAYQLALLICHDFPADAMGGLSNLTTHSKSSWQHVGDLLIHFVYKEFFSMVADLLPKCMEAGDPALEIKLRCVASGVKLPPEDAIRHATKNLDKLMPGHAEESVFQRFCGLMIEHPSIEALVETAGGRLRNREQSFESAGSWISERRNKS